MMSRLLAQSRSNTPYVQQSDERLFCTGSGCDFISSLSDPPIVMLCCGVDSHSSTFLRIARIL